MHTGAASCPRATAYPCTLDEYSFSSWPWHFPQVLGVVALKIEESVSSWVRMSWDRWQSMQTAASSDPAATAFTTSPWAYNGKLFCLSEEGQTFVIAAGDTFKLLHVNALDDMAQASPAIVGERLLIRTERRLYSIRRER